MKRPLEGNSGELPSVSAQEWIHFSTSARAAVDGVYQTFNWEDHLSEGKWCLFFSKENLDIVWEQAKEALSRGRILHVTDMKISTLLPSKRRRGDQHALVLYCSTTHRDTILESGRSIQKEFGYTHKPLYYKTNRLTQRGTAATNGDGRNYSICLRPNRSVHIPREITDEEWIEQQKKDAEIEYWRRCDMDPTADAGLLWVRKWRKNGRYVHDEPVAADYEVIPVLGTAPDKRCRPWWYGYNIRIFDPDHDREIKKTNGGVRLRCDGDKFFLDICVGWPVASPTEADIRAYSKECQFSIADDKLVLFTQAKDSTWEHFSEVVTRKLRKEGRRGIIQYRDPCGRFLGELCNGPTKKDFQQYSDVTHESKRNTASTPDAAVGDVTCESKRSTGSTPDAVCCK